MPQNIGGLVLLAVLAGIAALNNYYSLNIKAKTWVTASTVPLDGPPEARSPAPTHRLTLPRSAGGRGGICRTSRALW